MSKNRINRGHIPEEEEKEEEEEEEEFLITFGIIGFGKKGKRSLRSFQGRKSFWRGEFEGNSIDWLIFNFGM